MVSKLVQDGARVTVVMTDAASKFVGPATFEALNGRPVYTSTFANSEFPLGAHIGLAERSKLLVVAPATADFLAKAALGLADDFTQHVVSRFSGTGTSRAGDEHRMWSKAAVQRNVEQIRKDGVQFVDPGEGWLSCRQVGAGRMAEPDAIRTAIEKLLG